MLTGTRILVGFGFGPIQAGLFLAEACRSGGFGRLVVAEVAEEVVESVRRSDGRYHVNVAHADRLERIEVGRVELENPNVADDRKRLVDALAAAHEIATAVPSVECFASDSEGSLHRVLALGLRKKASESGPLAVVYSAENDNRAAEILEELVMSEIPEHERPLVRSRVQFLNTVIGKMSSVVTDPGQIKGQKLTPVVPGEERAFLVEAFNRILISKVRDPSGDGQPAFDRTMPFEEKEDLLPFEEAKLYGHNATHALAAYVGRIRGVKHIAGLRDLPGVLPFLRGAFIEESGEALVRKYRGIDWLFTYEGYRQYADDLLERMTNPLLGDTVERVGREARRKLAWNDRLVGTLRLALRKGLEPKRFALGVAAAVESLQTGTTDRASGKELLRSIWRPVDPPAKEVDRVLDFFEGGLRRLRHWVDSDFLDLEMLMHKEFC